jgi:hypothetical protein
MQTTNMSALKLSMGGSFGQMKVQTFGSIFLAKEL